MPYSRVDHGLSLPASFLDRGSSDQTFQRQSPREGLMEGYSVAVRSLDGTLTPTP